jgi:hypothetical protein
MGKKLEWTTVQRKVNDILPLEFNPRKISEAKRKKLIESLEKFNLAEIPAINKDNTVISGNQRLKALQLMGRGDELIDVRMPNRKLTQKELKEYALIANTHAGEWDMDIMEEFFSDMDLDDIGLDMNFDLDDIAAEEPKERKKSEKKELKDYVQTHVLISFPPERLLDIQEYLEKIKEFEFVEYEQSSN